MSVLVSCIYDYCMFMLSCFMWTPERQHITKVEVNRDSKKEKMWGRGPLKTFRKACEMPTNRMP